MQSGKCSTRSQPVRQGARRLLGALSVSAVTLLCSGVALAHEHAERNEHKYEMALPAPMNQGVDQMHAKSDGCVKECAGGGCQ